MASGQPAREQSIRAFAAVDVVTPTLVLTPGIRLRAEAGAALLELEHVHAGDRTALRAVHDNLRGALAHTAAVGETCLIAGAADAARTAAEHLAAAQSERARAALAESLTRLAGQDVNRR